MSGDIAIRAAGLGKKYVIGHQADNERYTTLRDVIGRRAKAILRTTADMLHGRAMVAGDTTEEIWALKDVDFAIKRGEVVGVIGRNGAGKSTLLKILSRITEPSEGQVTIEGRVASLLEVGTGFHPELSGRENIYLNGAILGMSRAEIRRKFDDIVGFAEVEKFLDTPVKRYSSGMYLRLAFAVAVHLEAEIVILDEILAVGDAGFQRKCLTKMEAVSRNGRTIIFVNHNMAQIRSLCTRAILLNGGRMSMDGDVETTTDYYLGNQYDSGSDIRWSEQTAPRCPQAVLRRAYVIGETGAPTRVINSRSSFSIVVEYELFEAMKQFRVGLLLQDSNGVCVTGSTDWGSWASETRGPGVFSSECSFPGNLLNHGLYRVCFAVDSSPHLERHLVTDYCLSFEIEDLEGHGPLATRIPGIVKPSLQWIVLQESAHGVVETLEDVSQR
ncbi:MAG: ABC transporter ATP-binding protein [Xanthobacteraceae bacterium]